MIICRLPWVSENLPKKGIAIALDTANEEKIMPIPKPDAPSVSANRGSNGITIPIPSIVVKTATYNEVNNSR